MYAKSSTLKAALKQAFPSVKFSVRVRNYAGGCSADVTWTDGPIVKDVEKYTNTAEGATFDGMTDMKSYKKNDDRQIADYVFCHREHTDAFIEKCIQERCDYHGIKDRSVITLEAYKQGVLWRIPVMGVQGYDAHWNLQASINRKLSETAGE